MSLIDDLAGAIARFEGFYSGGSLAARNNNPGNLRSWGNYPVVDGYVQFPDAETGWAALRSQVQRNIGRGLNLLEFFGGKIGVYPGYAPAADGNRPRTYAQTVARWLGISTDQPLSEISPGQPAPAASSPALPAYSIPGLSIDIPDLTEIGAELPGWVPLAAAAVGAVSLIVWLWQKR